MRTILVTGGAGFIGSHYIRYVLNAHEEVRVVNLDLLTYAGNLDNLSEVRGDPRYRFVQGDICDRELLERLFSERGIDAVVNFAAETHVDRSISGPEVFVRTNVMGALALLDAAKAAWHTDGGGWRRGGKYVQVSTDEVYGSLGATGFFTETTPLDPRSPYSASKASADCLVKAWWDTYGLPVNITRCSNNYGPCQFPEKLIPLMIHNALAHRELPVYGDGLQVRDWLYVEDHCAAIDLVLEGGEPGEAYNIGGHNERTNLEIVRAVIAGVRERADSGVDETLIRHVADRKGHDRRYGIDPGKIRRELGWEPETRFEDGIIRTIRWYLENGDWLRRVTTGEYQDY